ncbi:MAG: hypothetical protein NW241_13565 [Bacteroidia bacterium]|nr:hypothetical protein [Bacteroidia bacterium]
MKPPTRSIGWAPGNRWFLAGFAHAVKVQVDEAENRVLPFPFFLAAKYDAFFDRGITDVFGSTDLEDLAYLMAHVSDIVAQITSAHQDVRIPALRRGPRRKKRLP